MKIKQDVTVEVEVDPFKLVADMDGVEISALLAAIVDRSYTLWPNPDGGSTSDQTMALIYASNVAFKHRYRTAVSAATALTSQEKDLIAGGHVIQAIKSYRERTGTGLKEAKDRIDHYRNTGK